MVNLFILRVVIQEVKHVDGPACLAEAFDSSEPLLVIHYSNSEQGTAARAVSKDRNQTHAFVSWRVRRDPGVTEVLADPATSRISRQCFRVARNHGAQAGP